MHLASWLFCTNEHRRCIGLLAASSFCLETFKQNMLRQCSPPCFGTSHSQHTDTLSSLSAGEASSLRLAHHAAKQRSGCIFKAPPSSSCASDSTAAAKSTTLQEWLALAGSKLPKSMYIPILNLPRLVHTTRLISHKQTCTCPTAAQRNQTIRIAWPDALAVDEEIHAVQRKTGM